MKDKREFKKYRQRIAKEGLLKSIFIGSMLGCAALVVIAFLTWFFAYKPGLFIAIAAFVAVTAATAPLFYFFKYRPSVKEIARRVDGLGLEERMLTMNELEGDDSLIAQMQREDTMRALGTVDHMLIKIALTAIIIVPFSICCALGLGMTTVSSLYYADVIPSGIVSLSAPYTQNIYTVTYSVEPNVTTGEDGAEVSTINGTIIYWTGDWSKETQVNENGDKVLEGDNARPVYAIPNDNYVFVAWSDGYANPYRQDTVIDEDVFVQAIFEAVPSDPDQQQSEQDSQSGENGDGDSQNGQGENQDGEGQEGEPQDSEQQDGEKQDSDSNDENSDKDDDSDSDSDDGLNRGDGASGSRDLGSQQIVDGQTYYGDEYDDAYNSWQDRRGSDNNIPDDLKDFIEDYYGSIETNS